MPKKKLKALDLPRELSENLNREEFKSLKLELRSIQSFLSLPYLSEKQETLLLCLISNVSYEKSLIIAGYKQTEKPIADKFLSSKKVAQVIFYFKEKTQNHLHVTRQTLSKMAMDCYNERSTSGEGIRVIEVLSRLWGLNKENHGSRITINTQQNVGVNEKEQEKYLKSLSSDELKKIASNNLKGITLKDEENIIESE